MLQFSFDETEATLTLSPEGQLTKEDFQKVNDEVNPFIEENGELKGLIIETKSVKDWGSWSGLINHLKFVKEHHRQIRKVATITDNKVLAAAPSIASHFVRAEVKLFATDAIEEAKIWINSPEEDLNISMIPFPNKPVIGIQMMGKMEKRDLLMVQDEIELKLATFDKVGLYVEVEDYRGFTLEAFCEDLRYGLSKWKRFSFKAVVCDKGWIANMTKMASKVIPMMEIRHFTSDQKATAKAWVENGGELN